jgi:hypothetical protein
MHAHLDRVAPGLGLTFGAATGLVAGALMGTGSGLVFGLVAGAGLGVVAGSAIASSIRSRRHVLDMPDDSHHALQHHQ